MTEQESCAWFPCDVIVRSKDVVESSNIRKKWLDSHALLDVFGVENNCFCDDHWLKIMEIGLTEKNIKRFKNR